MSRKLNRGPTSAQVMRGVHVKSRLTLAWSFASLLIFITCRAADSGLCTRQSTYSHSTTVQLLCCQGHQCLDKYASVPQRRCSYFLHSECKFLSVIPVYNFNAPGQNENEYSHRCTLTHKLINTDISISAYIHTTANNVPFEQSIDWSRLLICSFTLAAEAKSHTSECFTLHSVHLVFFCCEFEEGFVILCYLSVARQGWSYNHQLILNNIRHNLIAITWTALVSRCYRWPDTWSVDI